MCIASLGCFFSSISPDRVCWCLVFLCFVPSMEMEVGEVVGRGALLLDSDVDPSDLVIPCPAAPFFFADSKPCCQIFYEVASLVRSRVAFTGLWWSSICARVATSVEEVAAACLHRVSSRCVRANWVAYPFVEEDGAVHSWELVFTHGMLSLLIQAMDSIFLSNELQMCSNFKQGTVLQVALYMTKGIPAPVRHCSACLEIATRGLCWEKCDGHGCNLMLDAAMRLQLWSFDQVLQFATSRSMPTLVLLKRHCLWRPHARRSVSTSSSSELHFYTSRCGALYSLQATKHDVYAVLLFGIRRRQVRVSLLRILRFNGQDPPGLSSVMAHLDFQLIPYLKGTYERDC